MDDVPRGGRRPIERYVRAAVAIPGSKGRADGTIEIGLHSERVFGVHLEPIRATLIDIGEAVVRGRHWDSLDVDVADEMTHDLDARIVAFWGDRPRFIEIWRGRRARSALGFTRCRCG